MCVCGKRIYNRWFLGLEKSKETIQRKKRREIYVARVHLIKHLVELSDQSKRKTGKKLLFVFLREYIRHNVLTYLIPMSYIVYYRDSATSMRSAGDDDCVW